MTANKCVLTSIACSDVTVSLGFFLCYQGGQYVLDVTLNCQDVNMHVCFIEEKIETLSWKFHSKLSQSKWENPNQDMAVYRKVICKIWQCKYKNDCSVLKWNMGEPETLSLAEESVYKKHCSASSNFIQASNHLPHVLICLIYNTGCQPITLRKSEILLKTFQKCDQQAWSVNLKEGSKLTG